MNNNNETWLTCKTCIGLTALWVILIGFLFSFTIAFTYGLFAAGVVMFIYSIREKYKVRKQ